MTTTSPWLKVFLQCALLGIFLVFFGFPSIEKYQKKETITVSSEKFTNGISPPVLTILGIQNSGLGWKTPQDGLDNRNSFKFDEHCAILGGTTIEDCIEKDTFDLADVVKDAKYGFSNSNNSPSFFWTEDFTDAKMGKHHTLKSRKTQLTRTPDDMLITFLHKNLSFAVFVHDENFFVVNLNPLGPPINMLYLTQPITNSYLD